MGNRKETSKEYHHRYYIEHRERISKMAKKDREKNKAKYIARERRYYQEHKEQEHIRGKKKYRVWKRKVISHYSKGKIECAECGHRNIDNLCIDHPLFDGGRFRKENNHKGGIAMYLWIIRNHYPKGLRVLCCNCNCSAKSIKRSDTEKSRYIQRLKQETFKIYCKGIPKCEYCGIKDIDKLLMHSIVKNHIPDYNGKGYKRGCELNLWLRDNQYPKGYKVMCYNCEHEKHR